MSFAIKNKKLLEKYESIYNRISNMIGQLFDKQTVYHRKHMNTKLKSYSGNINTDFYNKIHLKRLYVLVY